MPTLVRLIEATDADITAVAEEPEPVKSAGPLASATAFVSVTVGAEV